MKLDGIHHITCITADAPGNVDFYARVLGMRFVKKTVNFDAPDVYHLYYGDEHGAPGSILTFFEFPDAAPGRAGAGMIHLGEAMMETGRTAEGMGMIRRAWIRFTYSPADENSILAAHRDILGPEVQKARLDQLLARRHRWRTTSACAGERCRATAGKCPYPDQGKPRERKDNPGRLT